MSESIVKVENLGKKYIIGHQGTKGYKTFREQVLQHVHNFYSRTKKLVKGQEVLEGDELEDFWALKDLNFEIQKGDRVGIIGKNGAGKSTLLKVLSRITEPTTGKVYIKGRVASLLEVGTGFHPELTGRENIFLNGTIMGMSRAEIKRKFEEIVDFSGVENFLDTPVKRYSSGMYVRLAFSVAAHLEPEILVVDEVLAVGDAEFQKKCLGKMKDVSASDGRTVLFVSHNMTAIRSLCNRGFLINKGVLDFTGEINDVVDKYLQNADSEKHKKWDYAVAPGNGYARLLEVQIKAREELLFIENPVSIYFKVQLGPSPKPVRKINFSLILNNQEGVPVFNVANEAREITSSIIEACCHIPANFLNDDYYQIRLLVVEDETIPLFDLYDVITFKMMEKERLSEWHGKWIGAVRPLKLIEWT